MSFQFIAEEACSYLREETREEEDPTRSARIDKFVCRAFLNPIAEKYSSNRNSDKLCCGHLGLQLLSCLAEDTRIVKRSFVV